MPTFVLIWVTFLCARLWMNDRVATATDSDKYSSTCEYCAGCYGDIVVIIMVISSNGLIWKWAGWITAVVVCQRSFLCWMQWCRWLPTIHKLMIVSGNWRIFAISFFSSCSTLVWLHQYRRHLGKIINLPLMRLEINMQFFNW